MMTASPHFPIVRSAAPGPAGRLGRLASFALRRLPLAPLRPVLRRLARGIAGRSPELFARLGAHARSRFLIDPTDLPVVFLLRPEAEAPQIEIFRRGREPAHDARIAGRLDQLIDMVEGRIDGDAIFFSRDLRIDGQIEAVVALRNAIDSLAIPLADGVAGRFGRPGRAALAALRCWRDRHGAS